MQYLTLGKLRQFFPSVPIMALSASLSRQDLNQTCQFLAMKPCKLVTLHPDRKNLFYTVMDADNRQHGVVRFIEE